MAAVMNVGIILAVAGAIADGPKPPFVTSAEKDESELLLSEVAKQM